MSVSLRKAWKGWTARRGRTWILSPEIILPIHDLLSMWKTLHRTGLKPVVWLGITAAHPSSMKIVATHLTIFMIIQRKLNICFLQRSVILRISLTFWTQKQMALIAHPYNRQVFQITIQIKSSRVMLKGHATPFTRFFLISTWKISFALTERCPWR